MESSSNSNQGDGNPQPLPGIKLPPPVAVQRAPFDLRCADLPFFLNTLHHLERAPVSFPNRRGINDGSVWPWNPRADVKALNLIAQILTTDTTSHGLTVTSLRMLADKLQIFFVSSRPFGDEENEYLETMVKMIRAVARARMKCKSNRRVRYEQEEQEICDTMLGVVVVGCRNRIIDMLEAIGREALADGIDHNDVEENAYGWEELLDHAVARKEDEEVKTNPGWENSENGTANGRTEFPDAPNPEGRDWEIFQKKREGQNQRSRKRARTKTKSRPRSTTGSPSRPKLRPWQEELHHIFGKRIFKGAPEPGPPTSHRTRDPVIAKPSEEKPVGKTTRVKAALEEILMKGSHMAQRTRGLTPRTQPQINQLQGNSSTGNSANGGQATRRRLRPADIKRGVITYFLALKWKDLKREPDWKLVKYIRFADMLCDQTTRIRSMVGITGWQLGRAQMVVQYCKAVDMVVKRASQKRFARLLSNLEVNEIIAPKQKPLPNEFPLPTTTVLGVLQWIERSYFAKPPLIDARILKRVYPNAQPDILWQYRPEAAGFYMHPEVIMANYFFHTCDHFKPSYLAIGSSGVCCWACDFYSSLVHDTLASDDNNSFDGEELYKSGCNGTIPPGSWWHLPRCGEKDNELRFQVIAKVEDSIAEIVQRLRYAACMSTNGTDSSTDVDLEALD
ncbi:hypothetical protein TWF481_008675 [Arthrobotrys musiformis]|uniref:Uncharacterized protein n=1 Tax=Arthrobotrys musiformis TaxID=47236 RepID=A0AAV9W9S3_9PEZI